MSEYTITSAKPTSIESIALPKKPLRKKERIYHMSHEEFWERSDDWTHAEWVEGVVTVFMPPGECHQSFSGFLYHLIAQFTRLFGLGKVYFAPFEVCIRPNRSYREPDLFFVAQHRLHLLTEKRMEDPPDLIIEIVSKESVKRDRVEKYHEYEQAGVREYWVFDPRSHKQSADLYTLNDHGTYQKIVPDTEGRYHSIVLPGFWVRPSWLKHVSSPDVDDIILEMCGELYAQRMNEKMLQREGDTHAQRMIEQLFAQKDDRYAQRIIEHILDQENDIYTQKIIEHLLKKKGRSYVQRIIEQQHDILPEQES